MASGRVGFTAMGVHATGSKRMKRRLWEMRELAKKQGRILSQLTKIKGEETGLEEAHSSAGTIPPHRTTNQVLETKQRA